MRTYSPLFVIVFALSACQPQTPVTQEQASSSSQKKEVVHSSTLAPRSSESEVGSFASSVSSASPKKDWRTFAKPSDAILRKELTPLQYQVTQEEGTEQPYNNLYWDNHAEGIYVEIVSRESLFSSKDKYDSGTGWPSFTKPLMPENIVTKTDTLLGHERNEVRSKHANSHLGHVFTDGPQPTGLRYCMDSASLRFIPKTELKAQGYGEFENLF